MSHIRLLWSGPHQLDTPAAIRHFAPPAAPGVYLWVAGGPAKRAVSYVGQTESLAKRFQQHCVAQLGGGYVLYPLDEIRAGDVNSQSYVANSPAEYFAKFLANWREMTQHAFENFAAYEFYWAEVAGDKRLRELVESALITFAQSACPALQNNRPQRGPHQYPPTTILSVLPSAVSAIRGLSPSIAFGTLAPE